MYPHANPYQHLSGTVDLKRIRPAGFREHRFDTGSVRSNYVVGPDSGPPLVLVPAQIGTWESYQRVLGPCRGGSTSMPWTCAGTASPAGPRASTPGRTSAPT